MIRLLTLIAAISPMTLQAAVPEVREHSSIFAIAEFWLAIATVAMMIMLYAVHRIVSQR